MDNNTPEYPLKPHNDLPMTDVGRWESEGGHPPVARHEEHIPKVTNILKKFLIGLRRPGGQEAKR